MANADDEQMRCPISGTREKLRKLERERKEANLSEMAYDNKESPAGEWATIGETLVAVKISGILHVQRL